MNDKKETVKVWVAQHFRQATTVTQPKVGMSVSCLRN